MSAISNSCSSMEQYSNLQNFLHSVTPIINHASFPLNEAMGVEAKNRDVKLQDIWEIYDEWSSCGVGVPVSLENGENIVQYYVPYLSAIQIFIKKATSTEEEEIDSVDIQYDSSRNDDDDDDDDGDGDDDSTKSNDESPRQNEVISEGSKSDNGFFVGDHDLYVQFFELCSPYSRVPFLDKIVELAQSYPGLLTLYVNDISPASWMSVAWYPIYHIPAGVYNSKDLYTCFLTFHTLSCSFQVDNDEESVEKDDNAQVLDLVPFGLATYKMQGNVWNNNHKGDDEKIKDLESAAFSWLRQLHIQHPDYIFFTQ